MINKANPSAQYLMLEQYKAAVEMANGNAAKLIVPSDVTNLSSGIASIAEAAGFPKDNLASK